LDIPLQPMAGTIGSDAISSIAATIAANYTGFLGRVGRTIAVMMEISATEQYADTANDKIIHIKIEDDDAIPGHQAGHMAPGHNRALSFVRTDLDRFQDTTIRGLVRHGYVRCLATFHKNRVPASLVNDAVAVARSRWYEGLPVLANPTGPEDVKDWQRDGERLNIVAHEVCGFAKAIFTSLPGALMVILLILLAYFFYFPV
jgi:hypothetical protein